MTVVFGTVLVAAGALIMPCHACPAADGAVYPRLNTLQLAGEASKVQLPVLLPTNNTKKI